METQEQKLKVAKKTTKEASRPTVWLKTLAQTATKMHNDDMLTKEELEQIKTIHAKAVHRHFGDDMFK